MGFSDLLVCLFVWLFVFVFVDCRWGWHLFECTSPCLNWLTLSKRAQRGFIIMECSPDCGAVYQTIHQKPLSVTLLELTVIFYGT